MRAYRTHVRQSSRGVGRVWCGAGDG